MLLAKYLKMLDLNQIIELPIYVTSLGLCNLQAGSTLLFFNRIPRAYSKPCISKRTYSVKIWFIVTLSLYVQFLSASCKFCLFTFIYYIYKLYFKYLPFLKLGTVNLTLPPVRLDFESLKQFFFFFFLTYRPLSVTSLNFARF